VRPWREVRVRDQQGQPFGDARAVADVGVQEVLVGVDADEALDVQAVGDVDVDDPGVRVRAPDERRGPRPRTRSATNLPSPRSRRASSRRWTLLDHE
jgi:hypothetical protein